MTWEPYRGSTVVGDVRVLRGERDLYAYLPPSHGSGRYPLLVMHDGLNLFDEPISNNGEWQVDETMEALAGEGLEAVVVGVPHGPDRSREYAGRKGSAAYLRYLVDTVVPLARDSFDLDTRRESTGLLGSSLGGVISLHGLYSERDTFGLAGVFSPAFWVNGGRLFDVVANEDPPAARIYMDVGTNESDDDETRRAYADDFERMRALLAQRGFGDDRLLTVLDDGGVHHETAWARRLPAALRFLLS